MTPALIHLVVSVLFAHWIADFVLQTRWMAENKSHSFKALGFHVVVYGLVMWVMLFNLVSPQWILINVALHFAIDSITSKLNTYFWQNGQKNAFFITVGFDQFLHSFFLIATLGA